MTSKPAITSDMIDSTPATIDPPRTLREAVEQSMTRYFQHLDGGNVTDLHAMVMAEVEAPLLQAVMLNTEGNQTLAAQMLGLNRGTLRKKLKQYDLI